MLIRVQTLIHDCENCLMSFYFPLILLSVIPYFRRNLPRRPGLSSKSPFPTCTVKMANGTLDKLSYLKRYMSDGKDSAEQNRKKKKKKRNLGNGYVAVLKLDFCDVCLVISSESSDFCPLPKRI